MHQEGTLSPLPWTSLMGGGMGGPLCALLVWEEASLASLGFSKPAAWS